MWEPHVACYPVLIFWAPSFEGKQKVRGQHQGFLLLMPLNQALPCATYREIMTALEHSSRRIKGFSFKVVMDFLKTHWSIFPMIQGGFQKSPQIKSQGNGSCYHLPHRVVWVACQVYVQNFIMHGHHWHAIYVHLSLLLSFIFDFKSDLPKIQFSSSFPIFSFQMLSNLYSFPSLD